MLFSTLVVETGLKAAKKKKHMREIEMNKERGKLLLNLKKAFVSTDEGKDSSNPAQSGIRNSNCFGSKGLMMFENLRYKTISATQNFNHETI